MRNNNKIGIVSISEIQGLDFIIPDYQRGYRWEELQVAELLKDLNILLRTRELVFTVCNHWLSNAVLLTVRLF